MFNPQELAPEMHAAYGVAMNLLSDNEVLSNHKVLVVSIGSITHKAFYNVATHREIINSIHPR